MRLLLYIASRYLFAKKKTNFSNIIAGISIAALSVGTAALVVSLSVFNGMEDLLRKIHGSFDAELKVVPAEGKVFAYDAEKKQLVENTTGVAIVSEVIEDDALLEYNNESLIVRLKGVSENYTRQTLVDSMLVAGSFSLQAHEKPAVIMGVGVADRLGVAMRDYFVPMKLAYPKRNIAFRGLSNPEKNLNTETVVPSGIFSIEKRLDDQYVFAPLETAQALLNYEEERSYLEIKIAPSHTVNTVKRNLEAVLGADFLVQTRDEQHVSLLRAVKIEKLFISLILSVILLILSFNFYCSLRLLVIEKKKDIAVLYAIGASGTFIKKLFLTEGLLMAFISAVIGLGLGFVICFAQETYGLVPMGMGSSLVEHYPVKVLPGDFLFAFFALMAITFLAMYQPAVRAMQTNIKDNI